MQARYKILMDPTVDHVRGLCLSLRRMAKVGALRLLSVSLQHV